MKRLGVRDVEFGGETISFIGNSPRIDFDRTFIIVLKINSLNEFFFSITKNMLVRHIQNSNYRLLFDHNCETPLEGNPNSMNGRLVALAVPGIAAISEISNNFFNRRVIRALFKYCYAYSGGCFERLDSGRSNFDLKELRSKSLKFLVHSYSGESILSKRIIDELQKIDVMVHFNGKLSALIGTQKRTKVKTLMRPQNGLLILVGFEEQTLLNLLQVQFYKKFIDENDENEIGLFSY